MSKNDIRVLHNCFLTENQILLVLILICREIAISDCINDFASYQKVRGFYDFLRIKGMDESQRNPLTPFSYLYGGRAMGR